MAEKPKKWRQAFDFTPEKGTQVLSSTILAYRSVFPQNHPLLKSEVIYARFLDEQKNAELMRQFTGRKFYIADGPSITEYPFSSNSSP